MPELRLLPLTSCAADAVRQLADNHPRLFQALRRLERSSDDRLSSSTLAKVRSAQLQALGCTDDLHQLQQR